MPRFSRRASPGSPLFECVNDSINEIPSTSREPSPEHGPSPALTADYFSGAPLSRQMTRSDSYTSLDGSTPPPSPGPVARKDRFPHHMRRGESAPSNTGTEKMSSKLSGLLQQRSLPSLRLESGAGNNIDGNGERRSPRIPFFRQLLSPGLRPLTSVEAQQSAARSSTDRKSVAKLPRSDSEESAGVGRARSRA